MKRASLTSLFEFRHKKIKQLEDRKISYDDLANYVFGFVVRHHVKPVTKAQNKSQILLNYFYWLTFIERKVVMEEHLIDMELGTKEQLFQSVRIYVKRRDKMVSRLLIDLKETPKKITKIGPNHYEILLNDDTLLFASKDVIDELGQVEIHNDRPTYPLYSHYFILPY